MIRIITGAPGAGKSLRCMWWLTQDEYTDDEGNPRLVYSNIPGTDHLPLPENEDWTKTPEGSIVIYDEAQQFFPATGKAGNSTDPRIQALETHRHTGHDLIFITQRYALIHHHIRALAGVHEHLLKKGFGTSVIFSAGEVFDPKDRGKNATITEEVWKHPKQLFDTYSSSSLHTKAQTKTRIPSKFKLLAVAVLLLGGYASWAGYQTFQNIGDPYERSEDDPGEINAAAADLGPVASTQPKDKPVPAWQKKGKEGLSGCVSSESGCQCYDSEGLRVELPEQVCRAEIKKPMVSRVQGFGRSGDDRRRQTKTDEG